MRRLSQLSKAVGFFQCSHFTIVFTEQQSRPCCVKARKNLSMPSIIEFLVTISLLNASFEELSKCFQFVTIEKSS